jgi:serine/threonine protein kinase
VYEAGRTGFEEVRDFQAPVGTVIAGRYRVKDYMGSAAFSMALSCEDMHTHTDVCLKVIKNNKDFLDQSLDEIKLLRYINTVGDADEHNVLILHEYFYYKEHLILVTELLKDNLYEFQKYLMENKQEPYFTLPRLQRIAQQVLRALAFIHSKGLIHCDLKPENILIKSYSRCDVKVIDFGSSCFITDHLSTYIQSRSYRAPEVTDHHLPLLYASRLLIVSGCGLVPRSFWGCRTTSRLTFGVWAASWRNS